MIRLVGSGVPAVSVGQYVPYLFNSVRQALALPAAIGQVDQVVGAMSTSAPANGGTLTFSDPAVVSALASNQGTLQIDSERVAYSGRAGSTVQSITRGVNNTVTAPHANGATIYELLNTLPVVLGENPLGGQFPTQSVDQVYVNGVAKAATDAPTHTVNLADTTLIPGRSLVTVTFDLAGLVTPGNPSPSFLGSLAPVGGASLTASVTAGSARATGFVLGTGGLHAAVPAKPLPVQMPRGTAGTPIPAVRNYPASVMGTVTADVTGLQDDASGTLTGTPSLLLQRPAHLAHALLYLAFGETDAARYDLAGSWATTLANQAALGWTWSLRFVPMALDQVRALCGLQGQADLFLQDGVWRYAWSGPPTAVYTITPRVALTDPHIGWEPAQEITTVLEVTYNVPPYESRLLLTSNAGVARFGARRGRTLAMPWVTASAMAQTLGAVWLDRWDHQPRTLDAHLPWDAVLLEKTDGVATASLPLLSAADDPSARWIVREQGLDLDRAEWVIRCVDWTPTAVAASDTVSVRLTEATTRRQIDAKSAADTISVKLSEVPTKVVL